MDTDTLSIIIGIVFVALLAAAGFYDIARQRRQDAQK